MPKFETDYRWCAECEQRKHNALFDDAVALVGNPCKGDADDD